nr:class I SAM-dependent methyltransferase [Salibacterium salarium]
MLGGLCMVTSHWQRQDVTEDYLENVRGGIPFGAEQARIMLQVIHHFNPYPRKVIDLGCGNGFLAKIILKSFPDASAILLDHSKPMIESAKENMKIYNKRCDIILDDFHSIDELADSHSVDCIVSGFAIHHLPHSQKKQLYNKIYHLLSKGGIFINMEHTASATAELEALYDELFIDHLSSYNKKDRETVAKEYHSRPDKEDNILETVTVQLDWLKDIGFKHTDCYFKWFELAIFGGVKK